MFGADQIRVTNALLPPPGDSRHIYQTTFYPSVHAATRATPITLKSGEERTEIDVQLQPVRAVQVSGSLVDAAGPVSNFGVHLMPAEIGDGASVLEVATAVTDAAGAFVFPLVPAGSYTLLARRSDGGGARSNVPAEPRTPSDASGAWASQPLAVGDDHVRNVTLMLRPGVQITGRLEFHGTSEAPPAERFKQLSVAITPAQPVFRDVTVPASGPIRPSGEFTVRGVVPGRYIVTVREFSQTWTIQSVTVAGRDVTDSVMQIGDGDLRDVSVVFTDQPAAIEGTVTGASAANASVFLFRRSAPAGPTRARPHVRSERYAQRQQARSRYRTSSPASIMSSR